MSDPDFIPDSQFTPDAPATPPQTKAPTPDFIPDGQFKSDQDAATTPGQTYLGAFENAASTATAGLSKIAEQHPDFIPGPLGIAARALQAAGETTPEKVQNREENLPAYASIPSTIIGATGFGALADPGISGLLPEITGTAGSAAKIGAAATEGAGYGAVKGAATRESMGDPVLDSQKIAADAGMGALWGAGAGALFETIAPSLAKAMIRAKGFNEGLGETGGATGGGEPPASPGSGSPSTVNPQVVNDIPSNATYVDSTPVPKSGIQATSLEEIQAMNDAARARGESFALPQQAKILESAQAFPSKYPVTLMQYRSLDDQLSRDAYLATQVNPNGSGKPLIDYETGQRNELNQLTDKTIQDIAPGKTLTQDANKGGGVLTGYFSKNFQDEQKEIIPFFKALNEVTVNPVANILAKPQPLEESVPGVAGNLSVKDNILSLKPWKPSDPYSQSVHAGMQDIIDAANDPKMTVAGIRNVRDNLSRHLNISSPTKDLSQISGLKKSLMDYMQSAVDESPADLELRNGFKRWAVNQQNREVVESHFGSSVGNPQFGVKAIVGPVGEKIGDKVFKNSSTVAAAKQLLKPDQFGHALANWLTEQKDLATKDGVFSSNKFYTILKNNQDAINEAFKDHPEILAMIHHINTRARILPDAAPANPSGTAKTAANLLPNLFKALGPEDLYTSGASVPFKGVHELWNVFQRNRDEAKINSQLKGVSAANSVQSKIGNIASHVSQKIASSAKSIFSSGMAAGISAMPMGDYEKKRKRIQELASDPNHMLDHMTKTTAAIHEAAPDVAQGLHNTMAKGVQFLNSKLPRPVQELPISGKWQPSLPQKQTFNRYYQTVDDPIGALKRVKNGTLNNQDMEALQTVHPDLLNEMRMNVMQNIQKEKAHNLPNGTKIAISKLLGQPVDENMVPSSIQANQTAYLQPEQPKITVKGTKNLNMAKRSAGETDSD